MAVPNAHSPWVRILPLRHAVCNAEKTRRIPLKIARNRRKYADFALKPDWRKCPTLLSRQALWPFSLKGTLAVRFQRLRRANAMTSQIDHSAKAEFTFSFKTQWKPVLPRAIPGGGSSQGCLLRSPLI